MLLSIETTVRADVMPPVKIDIEIKPTTVHIKPNIFAAVPLGTLSPYLKNNQNESMISRIFQSESFTLKENCNAKTS